MKIKIKTDVTTLPEWAQMKIKKAEDKIAWLERQTDGLLSDAQAHRRQICRLQGKKPKIYSTKNLVVNLDEIVEVFVDDNQRGQIIYKSGAKSNYQNIADILKVFNAFGNRQN